MKKLIVTTLALALGGGMVIAAAPEAHAAPTLRVKALSTASAQKGDPYRWGATGPNAFDCSGLVYYSYRQHGKTLPRVAQAQYNASQKVSPANRKPGDLVFIGHSSRGIYHVGIFAGYWGGYGWMWDAPKPGRRVSLNKISWYTAGSPQAFYGRY